MYAIELDSCWQETRGVMRRRIADSIPDTLRDRLCAPTVALFDTTGLLRATFPGSRDAVWSPDGKTLAFRTVERPIYRGEEATVVYREQPRGVRFISPERGKSWFYPAATEARSWIDNEGLMLELRGRGYGLSSTTGKTGSFMIHAVEPTFMTGLASPDQRYVYRPGSLKTWSLFGRETDIV